MSVKRYPACNEWTEEDYPPDGVQLVAASDYDALAARLAKAEAALRQIWFLDHNERDWESIDEIKAFARAALADEPQKP